MSTLQTLNLNSVTCAERRSYTERKTETEKRQVQLIFTKNNDSFLNCYTEKKIFELYRTKCITAKYFTPIES